VASIDEVVVNGIKALSDITFIPHMIGVDYEDIRNVLRNCSGHAFLSHGQHGDSCNEACAVAIARFREASIDLEKAKGFIVGILAGEQLPLHSVSGLNLVQEADHEDAEIIFGLVDGVLLKNSVKCPCLDLVLIPSRRIHPNAYDLVLSSELKKSLPRHFKSQATHCLINEIRGMNERSPLAIDT
jgi:hypothetical protein